MLALLLGEALALRALTGRGETADRTAQDRDRRGLARPALAAAAGALATAWILALLFDRSSSDSGVWNLATALGAGPVPLTGFAVVSTVLALNLWGSLEMPLAALGSGSESPPRDRLFRHSLAGAFAPLVALPWLLPWIAGALGFTGSPAFAFALATAFALGLTLPWLAVAAAPRLLAALPPPGEGARALRGEGLGFGAAATTVWLLYRLAPRLSPESLAAVELSLLVLALLAWVRRRAAERTKLSRALARALALALAACALAALWLALPSNRP
jgi:suppressor for copper-sensitivity B